MPDTAASAARPGAPVNGPGDTPRRLAALFAGAPAIGIGQTADAARPVGPAARTAHIQNRLGSARRAREVTGLLEVLVRPGPVRPLVPLPTGGPVTTAARPGTGGRRKRIDLGFELEATRDLQQRYGEPTVETCWGQQLLVWKLEKHGDGIVSARLSSDDVQKGETALSQIHGGLASAALDHRRAAYAVVAMRTSGGADYDRRLDLGFIRDRIATEGLRWVYFREPDRVSRDQLSAQLFYRFLQDTATDLYLGSLGHLVDWKSQGDRLMVQTMGVIGEFERQSIKSRTHGAIIERWLKAGRGYPGSQGVGFRRDKHNFLEVDPMQWKYIVRIHHDYATLLPGGATSIREMHEHVKTLGFALSRDRIRKVLKDPVYVTGLWHTTYDGQAYPGRPIPLAEPIPLEVFEHNQALMAAIKGRQRTNPLGQFLLNRIDVRHAPCCQETDAADKPILLRAERNAYKHNKRPENPGCRRFGVPAATLDALVVRELLRLCESPELQAEYQSLAQASQQTPPTGILTKSQVNTLNTKIANLERQRAEMSRKWLADGESTGELDPRYLQDAVQLIDAEISGFLRQIQLSERLTAAASKPEPLRDRESLLQRARQVLTPTPPADPELRQRRIAFVRRALSRVVIHETPHGLAVELFGPLIPPDTRPLTFDPLEHARPALEHTDGTGFDSYARKSVPLGRGTLSPVWRSRRLDVGC